jgi:hypothetical protein
VFSSLEFGGISFIGAKNRIEKRRKVWTKDKTLVIINLVVCLGDISVFLGFLFLTNVEIS